ncbi:MAG: peptide deformylase [Chloroflexota bacterium]
MTLRRIFLSHEPVLRQVARPVTRFDDTLQTLIDDMLDTMRAAPGVGLAAPQVGQSLRLFVAEWPEDEQNPDSLRSYVLANPVLMWAGEEEAEAEEGCLSVPGYVGDVWRATEILVKGRDRYGKKVRIKATGWLARIFQHEMDHLEGILFIDRVDSPEKIRPVLPGEEEKAELEAAGRPTVRA